MWLVHLSNHSQARNVMTQVHWDVANHDKTKMNHYGMLGFHGKYESDACKTWHLKIIAIFPLVNFQ
jgi:hypothetical protein